MPECSARYPAQVLVGEMCSTNEVDQCGDHMTCVQVSSYPHLHISSVSHLPSLTYYLRPAICVRAPVAESAPVGCVWLLAGAGDPGFTLLVYD